MLKNYKIFSKDLMLNESAPKIPNSEEHWKNKGKIGKNVMLYFHDDLDGIYSAVAMKNYLEKKGFKIEGYGIVNYQEGWSTTVLNDKYINIALDYAENVEGIDVYMDHHGHFKEGENVEMAAVKTDTGSAYEGIMDQLGLPVDGNILNIIDMVDSAKYDDYDVDIKNILDFDPKKFKNKLEFAAAFNQLLKRSDHKTFIEVVANTKDMSPSIYNIFSLFKILYPANNLNNIQLKKLAKDYGFVDDNGKPDLNALIEHIKKNNPKQMREFEKDFLDDAYWRLGQMNSRTRGLNSPSHGNKDYIDSLEKFKEKFVRPGKGGNPKVEMPGYQIIGNMCFVPSGTWANALRARAILEQDLLNDDRVPVINYKISNDSPLYDELKNKGSQILELVGDIDKSTNTLKVKMDVTNDSSVEGIKGNLDNSNGKLTFKAKQPIFWILLQYGNTMQVCSLHKFNLYVKEYLPKLKSGETVDNLGKYCEDLLFNMAKYFGYNVSLIENATTKAGGHPGIGSISNIFGTVSANITSVPDPNNPSKMIDVTGNMTQKYNGTRFLDLIKNKMISDLSGIEFNDLKLPWGDPDEKPASKPRSEDMNKKVIMKDDIRKAQDVKKQYDDWEQDDIDAANKNL